MSGSPIRLGSIGMGPANMASTMTMLQYEPDLRYTITAACARRPKLLEQAARQFDIPFWSTDYRDVVSRHDVDVVCVYTPDALHAESCIAALRHLKHVVCTKPMVTTLEDARTSSIWCARPAPSSSSARRCASTASSSLPSGAATKVNWAA